jgi:hypothetical protein
MRVGIARTRRSWPFPCAPSSARPLSS